MARAADHLTLEEIDEQYGKIRGAALQSWVTVLIGCGLGVAFLGMPAVFGALAVLHTAGLPFVLAFVRRWRDGLIARARRQRLSRNPPRTPGGGGSARMRRPRSAQ